MSARDRLDVLEIRRLTPSWTSTLARFFDALVAAGDEEQFHPHPLTPAEAEKVCRHTGLDLYYALGSDSEILGYGMLRGWDEGFSVPSLGIAVHPSARGRGNGRALIQFLHAAAAHRGAECVRLSVHRTNEVGRRLYEDLGYTFTEEAAGKLVGVLRLR